MTHFDFPPPEVDEFESILIFSYTFPSGFGDLSNIFAGLDSLSPEVEGRRVIGVDIWVFSS